MDPVLFNEEHAKLICAELNRITASMLTPDWKYDANQQAATLYSKRSADVLRKVQGDLTKMGLVVVVGKSADQFMLRILHLSPDLEKLKAIPACAPKESVAINKWTAS